MRKLFGLSLLISVIILVASCSLSTGTGNKNNETNNTTPPTNTEKPFEGVSDLAFLKNCYIDLTDATALGLATVEPQSSGTRALSSSRGNAYGHTKKFVKTTGEVSEANAEDISFIVRSDIDTIIKDYDGNVLKAGEVISQDDFPYYIDKLYIAGDFTFISYVPFTIHTISSDYCSSSSIDTRSEDGAITRAWYKVRYKAQDGQEKEESITLRPDIDFPYGGYIDQDIVIRNCTQYDRVDYYSSDLRKSFIINNKTGKIYDVGAYNFSMDKGVITERSMGKVRLSLEGDSLKITKLIGNAGIQITDCFADKYGQVFALNESLDICDTERGVMYYTDKTKYVLSDQNVVIERNYSGSHQFARITAQTVSEVKKIGSNWERVEIQESDRFSFDQRLFSNWYDAWITKIENGYYYLWGGFLERSIYCFERYKISDSLRLEQKTYEKPSETCIMIDENVIGFLGNNGIYWENVFDVSGHGTIFEGHTLEISNYTTANFGRIPKLKEVTLSETNYYQISMKDGIPVLVEAGSVKDPEISIILQPIN